MRSSCVKAAASHQETGNTAMAMAMLKRACFLKHKDSCVKLAETALQSNLPGLAKDALQEGCRFKSKWACNELARLDSEKNALKTVASDDPEKSLMVWSLACSKGSPSGCRREGETEALLGRQDAARASFLRGCTLGDKLSCSQVIGVPAH